MTLNELKIGMFIRDAGPHSIYRVDALRDTEVAGYVVRTLGYYKSDTRGGHLSGFESPVTVMIHEESLKSYYEVSKLEFMINWQDFVEEAELKLRERSIV